ARARLVARSCGARPRVGKKQGRSHVSDGSAVEDSNWRAKSRQLQFQFAAVVRLGRDRGSGAAGEEADPSQCRAEPGGVRAGAKLSLLSTLRLCGVLLGLHFGSGYAK